MRLSNKKHVGAITEFNYRLIIMIVQKTSQYIILCPECFFFSIILKIIVFIIIFLYAQKAPENK